MKYLLDTNICIYALKQVPEVRANMMRHKPSEIGLSVISEAELRTGAARSKTAASTLKKIESFMAPLEVVEFTSHDASAYAQVRAALERAGTPVGPLDTLIAAQAVANALVLVTNNEREFKRVPGLRLENWSA